jgi:hypothetical protein
MPRGKTAVYVITTDRGVCKVGISNNPILRLEQLQTGSQYPLRLAYTVFHSDASRIEAMVHHALAGKHTYGEWFAVPDVVAQDAIARAAAKLGKPIKGSGYAAGGSAGWFWFWIVLAVIVMWMMFSFVFSLTARAENLSGPTPRDSYCIGLPPEDCPYAWTLYQGWWWYSSWKKTEWSSLTLVARANNRAKTEPWLRPSRASLSSLAV